MSLYPLLKDDSGPKSVSNSERHFIRRCANAVIRQLDKQGESEQSASSQILRLDGRHPGEIRPIQLTFGRTHSVVGSGNAPRAECSVQLGMTRVSCIVTCDLIPPVNAETRPNDGLIVFNVDLSPMASMGYSSFGVSGGATADSQQKRMMNRLERTLEKVLVEGGAIDVESLCVVGGEWVWRLNVDITALDDAGNLVDAAILSAMATLRHFRKPHVKLAQESNESSETLLYERNNESTIHLYKASKPMPVILSSDEREPTPLPLHHTPLCVSFGLFGNSVNGVDDNVSDGISSKFTSVAALVDPSDREEMVMDGTVTYAFNKHGELCMTDFLGGCELSPQQLIQCAKLALQKAVEICTMLDRALDAADDKAKEERLQRLKQKSQNLNASKTTILNQHTGLGLLDTDSSAGDGPTVVEEMVLATIRDKDNNDCIAEDVHEEMVLRQALDYSVGHIAAKVREDSCSQNHSNGGRNRDNKRMKLRNEGNDGSNSRPTDNEVVEGKANKAESSTSLLIESMIRSAQESTDNKRVQSPVQSVGGESEISASKSQPKKDGTVTKSPDADRRIKAYASPPSTKCKSRSTPKNGIGAKEHQGKATEGKSLNSSDEEEEEAVVMLKNEFS